MQQITEAKKQEQFHFGHLGIIFLSVVFLLGASWLKNPELFKVIKGRGAAVAEKDKGGAPRYYAYEPSAEDSQPMVLGASTAPQGPVVINDDGTVAPVDFGKVLGASTQGVELSLDDVKVAVVPDSDAAIKKYFEQSQSVEGALALGPDFASALASNNQAKVDEQAQKIESILKDLRNLAVPSSLAKLHKLKVIQYESATVLLKNFTEADQNAEIVSESLQQFMKSQEDLDTENKIIAEKYGSLDQAVAVYAQDFPEPN